MFRWFHQLVAVIGACIACVYLVAPVVRCSSLQLMRVTACQIASAYRYTAYRVDTIQNVPSVLTFSCNAHCQNITQFTVDYHQRYQSTHSRVASYMSVVFPKVDLNCRFVFAFDLTITYVCEMSVCRHIRTLQNPRAPCFRARFIAPSCGVQFVVPVLRSVCW